MGMGNRQWAMGNGRNGMHERGWGMMNDEWGRWEREWRMKDGERGMAKGMQKWEMKEKSKDKKNVLSPFLLFSLHLNRYFTGKKYMR